MDRRQRSRRSSFPLHAVAPSCILNHMVQHIQANFDVSFGALSDATRRGVLEQLGRADASITALAQRFDMTLTGMKKHVGVLEQAGLVTTEKVGRVRTRRLRRHRLAKTTAWARPAPAGKRDRMARAAPSALGLTLRRVGPGCRGIETEGEGRWTQEEKVSP